MSCQVYEPRYASYTCKHCGRSKAQHAVHAENPPPSYMPMPTPYAPERTPTVPWERFQAALNGEQRAADTVAAHAAEVDNERAHRKALEMALTDATMEVTLLREKLEGIFDPRPDSFVRTSDHVRARTRAQVALEANGWISPQNAMNLRRRISDLSVANRDLQARIDDLTSGRTP